MRGCCRRMTLRPLRISRPRTTSPMPGFSNMKTPQKQSSKRSRLGSMKTIPAIPFSIVAGGTRLVPRRESRTPSIRAGKQSIPRRFMFSLTKMSKPQILITSHSAPLMCLIAGTFLRGRVTPMVARCTPFVFVTSRPARNSLTKFRIQRGVEPHGPLMISGFSM